MPSGRIIPILQQPPSGVPYERAQKHWRVSNQPSFESSTDPDALWAEFSHRISGQARVRVSRDSGRNYPQRYERDLTRDRPSQPAAVIIHGVDGACRTLCLDFDTSKGGQEAVDADVRALTQWLHDHGLKWIQDYSPNGGRHVYVPLSTPMPFHTSRDMVTALSRRHKSLDPTPHQNLRHGCIRVPGSSHKSGGYQKLEMSVRMAQSVFDSPADETAVQALIKDLDPEIHSMEAEAQTEAVLAISMSAPGSRMSRTMTVLASQGIYDSARYSSPSEARQAVVLAAAAAGMNSTDIDRRTKDGTWPGLAQFYARYSPANRSKALHRDWISAQRFMAQSRGKKSVQKTNTSEPSTQGGRYKADISSAAAEHQFIRSWRTALRIAEPRYGASKVGLARRMILRAIGEAAHKTESRIVEFGVRSLAVASGVEPTTVAAHLRALRSEPDPLIAHTAEAIGVNADQYTLVIPSHIEEGATEISWRKGKVHAMRPAFRLLGMPAAFVYEAIEHSPALVKDIVAETRMSRSTVHEALEILAAWNLVRRCENGWEAVASTSLAALAEILGVADFVADQIHKHRAERAAWRQWLAQRQAGPLLLLSPGDDYPWEEFEGPPDEWTLSDMMLRRAS